MSNLLAEKNIRFVTQTIEQAKKENGGIFLILTATPDNRVLINFDIDQPKEVIISALHDTIKAVMQYKSTESSIILPFAQA